MEPVQSRTKNSGICSVMLELNQIYAGDCLFWMEFMDDNSIDLVVMSPPYDNLRNYCGYIFDFEAIANQLWRVMKRGGVVVWVVGDATIKGSETGTSFQQALYFKNIGFNLHDTMIYAKNSYMPLTHNRYEQAFEYMFVFSCGRPRTFNPIMVSCVTVGKTNNRGGSKAKEVTYAERKRDEVTITKSEKQHSNIFYYDVGKNVQTKHNAPFPEDLVRDQILSWSNEGDLVLDPMCGSGTTCRAAKELERNYIGIEISEEYAIEARQNLNTRTSSAIGTLTAVPPRPVGTSSSQLPFQL